MGLQAMEESIGTRGREFQIVGAAVLKYGPVDDLN